MRTHGSISSTCTRGHDILIFLMCVFLLMLLRSSYLLLLRLFCDYCLDFDAHMINYDICFLLFERKRYDDVFSVRRVVGFAVSKWMIYLSE